jgi:hypothetical protein
MQAIIRSSRDHLAEEVEAESPVNDVEEAFERTTLSISRENSKVVKGNCQLPLFESFIHLKITD